MLTNLQIKNFLLIDELELDFYNGLTVITGETGSGKSITIDALMLIFGAKGSSEIIRSGQSQASFSATFLVDSSKILAWLQDREFMDSAEAHSIICRRVIDINGRSKAYINSVPVTLGVLKELGEMLLDIHTQHASIVLLKPENQRQLLDEFAGISADVISLNGHYQRVNELQALLTQAREFSQDLVLKQEILHEKITELADIALGENEWEALQIEQRQLANANYILQELDFVNNVLGGEQNSLADLAGTLNHRLSKISEFIPNYSQIATLSDGLEASINELEHELQSLAQKIEQDPERLEIVDARINEIYTLARKYRILPEEIPTRLASWQNELQNLAASADLEQLAANLELAKADYVTLATQISHQRNKFAQILSAKVSELLHQLAISGEFKIAVVTGSVFNSYGMDTIQYQVCFNQGMALQALNKVASGGELSRVALALYVTLSINNPPELIVFDEVDVGVGGGVAEVVGKLLRQLGQSKQVICITHQPQAACCGDRHILVQKHTGQGQTQAKIEYIDDSARVGEIARMLGGINITSTTTSHAQEMLSGAVKIEG